MESLLEKAVRVAVMAHEGQMRKTESIPYIVHPTMVALLLAKYGFSDTVLAAAMVHDVLEDTSFSPDTLKKELGDEVFMIVKTLTEDKSLPWEERKKRYVDAVCAGSDEAKAVSAADKIHNIKSIIAVHDKIGSEVWEKFNRGRDKKIWFETAMLAMLKETWNHPLITEYEALIKQILER